MNVLNKMNQRDVIQMEQQLKLYCLESIESEQEHRTQLSVYRDIAHTAIIKKIGGESIGYDWLTDEAKASLERQAAMYDDWDVDKLYDYRKETIKSIQHSKRTEKFHRYLHNLDYENAVKASEKIDEWWVDTMERIQNVCERNGEILVLMCNRTDKGHELHSQSKNEGGLMNIAEQSKESHEERKTLLKCLENIKRFKR